jgi:predicted nuclease of predicted toxin-antitoxin system
MRFLVDAQLPPALARWLVAQGHHAEHVAELKMEAASDAAIWRRAERYRAVIVTKDENFAIWRNARQGETPAVVWLRIGNTRRQELLGWFEPLLPKIVKALDQDETLVEVC